MDVFLKTDTINTLQLIYTVGRVLPSCLVFSEDKVIPVLGFHRDNLGVCFYYSTVFLMSVNSILNVILFDT